MSSKVLDIISTVSARKRRSEVEPKQRLEKLHTRRLKLVEDDGDVAFRS